MTRPAPSPSGRGRQPSADDGEPPAAQYGQQLPRCAVLGTLDVLHDLWTLGILRCVFFGLRRYTDIQRELGISTNVLADRLALLVDQSILVRAPYQQRPTRYEYVPTSKGAALAPVILALRDWGADHLDMAQSLGPLRHGGCDGEVHATANCSRCERTVAWDDVAVSSSPPSVG